MGGTFFFLVIILEVYRLIENRPDRWMPKWRRYYWKPRAFLRIAWYSAALFFCLLFSFVSNEEILNNYNRRNIQLFFGVVFAFLLYVTIYFSMSAFDKSAPTNLEGWDDDQEYNPLWYLYRGR